MIPQWVFSITTVIFLLWTLPSGAQEISGYDIIVVAGQSNAAGWGVGPDSLQPSRNDPKIFQWNWEPGANILAAQHPLKTPAQTNPKKIHGFALPFAREYSQMNFGPSSSRAALIVNGAVGGSSIAEWDPQKALYQQLIQAVRAGLKYGDLDNKVIAILWHQGEADIKQALTTPQPERYLKNYGIQLKTLVAAFRRDLAQEEKLPFIAGEMSRRWREPGPLRQDFVKNLQRVIMATENAGLATSENLRGNTKDQIHFDGKSLETLGRRYFDIFQRLTTEDPRPSCKKIF